VAQAATCRLAIAANVRLGPSAGALIKGTVPGELRGDLSFALGPDGAIDSGQLRVADGSTLTVVGQATGRAINLRVRVGSGQTLVLVGTAEQGLDRCTGAVDGLLTGPQRGDLGDWHATATALGGSAGQGAAATATTRPAGANATAVTVGGATATGTVAPTSTRTATATETATAAPTETATSEPTTTSTPEAPPTMTPVTCPTGTTDCSGICVDLQSDVDNCGACGHVCPEAQPGFERGCVEGTCFFQRERAPACEPGLSRCSEGCVDLASDAANCGACGNACAAGEVCFGGVCAREHRCAPLTNCADVCVDLSADAANCGACGNACAADEICFAGQCAREHRT
jgi:hypothetical protein